MVGKLEVDSKPEGAKIILDDTDTGQVTPYTFEDVVAGDHTVYFKLRFYTPETVSVEVEDNKKAKVDVKMNEKPIVRHCEICGEDAYYPKIIKRNVKIKTKDADGTIVLHDKVFIIYEWKYKPGKKAKFKEPK
jgi:hypothetical protein